MICGGSGIMTIPPARLVGLQVDAQLGRQPHVVVGAGQVQSAVVAQPVALDAVIAGQRGPVVDRIPDQQAQHVELRFGEDHGLGLMLRGALREELDDFGGHRAPPGGHRAPAVIRAAANSHHQCHA